MRSFHLNLSPLFINAWLLLYSPDNISQARFSPNCCLWFLLRRIPVLLCFLCLFFFFLISHFLNTALCPFFFMEIRRNGPATLLLPVSHLSPHWPVLSFCGCSYRLSMHFLRDHHTCQKNSFFSLYFNYFKDTSLNKILKCIPWLFLYCSWSFDSSVAQSPPIYLCWDKFRVVIFSIDLKLFTHTRVCPR